MKNNTPPSSVGGDEQTSHGTLKHHQRAQLILQARGLTATQKAILHAISHRTNRDNEAWPGQTLLASEAGLSIRGLRKALPKMAHLMETDTEIRRSTTYRIRWDVLKSMAQTPEHSSPRNTVPQEHSSPQPEPCSSPPRNTVPPTPEHSSPERYKNDPEERSKNGPPLSPPKGEPVDKSAEASPMEDPAEAVDKSAAQTSLIPTASPEKPVKADKAAEVWAQMEAIRVEHKPARAPRPIASSRDKRRRAVNAILKVHSAEDMVMVAEWLWTSKHHRAVFLRDKGHEAAILTDKFTEYAEIAREEQDTTKAGAAAHQQPSQGKQDSKTAKDADEAWGRVLKALRLYGPTPPGMGAEPWVFSNDRATADRYGRAILAAAEDATTLAAAWRTLYQSGEREDRLWQMRRFRSAYRRNAALAEVAA